MGREQVRFLTDLDLFKRSSRADENQSQGVINSGNKRKRIPVLYLPPYSPDLNPIERVWKLTRRMAVHNKYFPEINDIISDVEACFGQWTKPNEVLRRLCAIT